MLNIISFAYFCGDNISSDLDLELKSEGIKVKKIVNYLSETHKM